MFVCLNALISETTRRILNSIVQILKDIIGYLTPWLLGAEQKIYKGNTTDSHTVVGHLVYSDWKERSSDTTELFTHSSIPRERSNLIMSLPSKNEKLSGKKIVELTILYWFYSKTRYCSCKTNWELADGGTHTKNPGWGVSPLSFRIVTVNGT